MIKPLGDRVVIKALEAEQKTKSGIVLPDSAKKKQEQAKVIAIGNGKKDKKPVFQGKGNDIFNEFMRNFDI